VVLERHEVESGLLAELRQRDDVLRTPALRGDERSEAKLVAIVGHAAAASRARV
jgi:hypothetical protein